MKLLTHTVLAASLLATLAPLPVRAQPTDHGHGQPAPSKADAPQPEKKPDADKTGTAKRIGDPYPFATCPITGAKLGTMGDPVVKIYDGREIRFCCSSCPPKFEKDLAAGLVKIDEKIIADQGPLYPLKTSVVTGKELPAKPYELVYGNRLVRLGAESEKTDFLKDPKKHLADLDKAVVQAQGKDYPLKACPVSKEELGGDMGKPVDVVVAGRLVRVCCKDCKKDVEKEPSKFIAMINEARKGNAAKHDDGHKDDGKDHKHGG
jgi:hypothetical protein